MILAGLDTAWRKNSSALCIFDGVPSGKVRLIHEREWIPGEKPLRPKQVLSEAVAACRNRRVEAVCTDLRDIDHVADALEDTDIELVAFTTVPEEIYEAYSKARQRLSEEGLDFLQGSDKLLSQLVAVSMKPGEGGAMKIIVPSSGSAHGDIASAAVMGLHLFELFDPTGAYLGKDTRRYTREKEDGVKGLTMFPDHSGDIDS